MQTQTERRPSSDGRAVDFPVDLSREDYMEFNLLVAKTQGVLRHYRGILVFTGSLLILSFALLLYFKLRFGRVDLLTVLLMLLFLILVGAPLVGLPGHLRRTAAAVYDRTIGEGYRYAGRVHLEGSRICKFGSTQSVAIQLDDRASTIESRDMLIVLSPGRRAIVIPARYLTRENARELISRLGGALKKENQKVYSPIQPTAKQDDTGEDQELLYLEIRYTQKEFYTLLADRALRMFLKRWPFYVGSALFTGLLCGLAAGFAWGVAIFVCVLTGIYLFVVEGGRFRAKKRSAAVTERELGLQLTFTEKGLTLTRENGGEERRVPWTMVERAVSRPSCVEFSAGDAFIRVPNRCIPDLEFLKTVVDQHISSDGGRKGR